MENPTIIEMLQKAKRKKISCDINEKSLEMVDELAEIFEIKRSKMLDVLILAGLWNHVNTSIKMWDNMKMEKTSKEYKDKEKREKIDKLIERLKKFKEKWEIEDISS